MTRPAASTVRRAMAAVSLKLAQGDAVAQGSGFVAASLGVSALAGWWLGIDAVTSTVPGLLTTTVNTAIALALLGLSLALTARPAGGSGRHAGLVLAIGAIVLAALVGSQYVAPLEIGIDQWLFREPPGPAGTIQPNRMSAMTVLSVLMIGMAILISRSARARRAVLGLGLGAVLLGMLNVLDFVFGETPAILAGFAQMPLTAAAGTIALGFGVLALLPNRGPLELFIGDSSTARLARRLVIASVAGPVGLAWLHFRVDQDGADGPLLGITFMVLATFVLLAFVTWHAGGSARRIELDRTAALEERDRFFEVSKDLLVTASADGYFLRVNPAWRSVLGHEPETLTSRPFAEFIHPDDLSSTAREVDRQVRDGESVFNFQNRYRHRDGSYRWLEWTSAASDDGSRLYATARDVTARKLEEERQRAPALALEQRMAAAHDRVLSVIEAREFGPVYQPVVDLAQGRNVGFEALTRFADGWSPAIAFATAAECGLGRALEHATLAAAIAGAKDLPRRAWLSVNISPRTLADVDVLRAVFGLRARALVVEITEHETIDAYAPVREAVRALGPNVRLAVDDAGAGVANFNHLVELRPDFVKIDAGLVRGVDSDVSRQALVAGMLHFAAAAGCEVIAEGIETDEERATLERLGVRLGQGYLLGRPAAASEWDRSAPGISNVRQLRRPAREGRRAAG